MGNSETISSLAYEEQSQDGQESPNSTQVPISSHGLITHLPFYHDRPPKYLFNLNKY